MKFDTTDVTWYEDGEMIEYWTGEGRPQDRVCKEASLKEAIEFAKTNKMCLSIQPVEQDACLFVDYSCVKSIIFTELKDCDSDLLLALAKRANQLWYDGKCDPLSMHHIINAVSSQKFGFDDVMATNFTIFDGVDKIWFNEETKEIVIE